MDLVVELTHTERPNDIYTLECQLLDTPFKDKWLARYYAAMERGDKISEPWAFYNLNNEWTEEQTLRFLNERIDICNQIVPGLFDRNLDDINDQDTLNYLHAVFEETHGKLDEWKDSPIFKEHPRLLRESLSHINQTIHRCEGHGSDKKIRVVYFDLPKTELLSAEDYDLFTTQVDFGGVYMHYTDVGKPIEELAVANDQYHHDIVPYLHYSVDFSIRFYDDDGIRDRERQELYVKDNQQYLTHIGYPPGDPRLTPGTIKIAQLDYAYRAQVLGDIKHYNWIHKVIVR